MRTTKLTYIGRNQLKKYGFKINLNRKTDLEAFRTIEGIGFIRLFNYDYYTVRPDQTLMIDINGFRVYEGKCRSHVRFKEIMKRLNINKNSH